MSRAPMTTAPKILNNDPRRVRLGMECVSCATTFSLVWFRARDGLLLKASLHIHPAEARYRSLEPIAVARVPVRNIKQLYRQLECVWPTSVPPAFGCIHVYLHVI